MRKIALVTLFLFLWVQVGLSLHEMEHDLLHNHADKKCELCVSSHAFGNAVVPDGLVLISPSLFFHGYVQLYAQLSDNNPSSFFLVRAPPIIL